MVMVAGAPEAKVQNRWLIVAAGVIIHLCLGTLYAFSVFRNPLMDKFGWSVTETSFAFTICLVFFTITTLLAGWWQDKAGPRLVGSVGGLLLGTGCLLASHTNSLMMLYISYGVVAGSGVGFAYVTPIATIVKWFPDKRGLMTGFAVFGFGIGSLVFAPLAAKLIDVYGVLNTFAILGSIFIVVVTVAAQLLHNPPEGWKPAEWNPPQPKIKISFRKYDDYSPMEMLRTQRFWIVWATYFLGASAGLMIISQAAPMAEEMVGLSQEAAAAAVGIMAIFNGMGRIFWGDVSDRIGRNVSLLLIFMVYAADLFLVLPHATTYTSYVFGICAAALSFGGYLAIMPAITADYFGTKNLGINYGWMFTAYGAASLFGPTMIAYIKEISGGYAQALHIFAVLSLVGIALTTLNRSTGSKISQNRFKTHPTP